METLNMCHISIAGLGPIPPFGSVNLVTRLPDGPRYIRISGLDVICCLEKTSEGPKQDWQQTQNNNPSDDHNRNNIHSRVSPDDCQAAEYASLACLGFNLRDYPGLRTRNEGVLESRAVLGLRKVQACPVRGSPVGEGALGAEGWGGEPDC